MQWVSFISGIELANFSRSFLDAFLNNTLLSSSNFCPGNFSYHDTGLRE